MPAAFTGTPLFPIKEAVNSSSSLPQVTKETENTTNNKITDINTHIYEESRMMLLLENYKKSESEYQVELKTLLNIIENFDPVYNNYYDGSLEDITNEMVNLRKEKNSKLLDIVKNLTIKHNKLLQSLNLPNYDMMLMELSQWGNDIYQLYSSYIKFYKLDTNQSKTEIKIRRRPLIRIRYLNNFIKNLKSIHIQMKEKPYSGQLISNFETLNCQMSKCLDEARIIDEAEKLKFEKFINIFNAKDLVQLRSVCVSLNQEDFNTKSYICNLHFINKSQKAALNFLNIEVLFLNNNFGNSIVIIQKDSSGNNLLFSPIKQSELRFLNSKKDSNGKSLIFNHSIMKDDIQLCFTFNESKELNFESKLMELFPDINTKIIYRQSTVGLGLMLPSTTPIKKASTILPMSANSKEQIIKQKDEIKENIPPQNQQNIQIPARKSSNHILSSLNINSKSQSITKSNSTINLTLSKDIKKNIPQQILQEIANNDESSDEDDESIISKTEELHFLPIENVPTAENVPISENISISKTEESNNLIKSVKLKEEPVFEKEPIFEPDNIESVESKKMSIDISKYQNSLQIPSKEQKISRHKSIFGSLSNFLTKKNNKKSLIISEPLERQQQIRNTTNMQPTKSIKSISSINKSVKSSINSNNELIDSRLQRIISNSNFVSKPISNARISLWNRNNWTDSKNVKLILHINNLNKEYFMGAYEFKNDSNDLFFNEPILMLKLNNKTDCMFNIIDIHVTTCNYKDENLTVLIRSMDSNDIKLIGNALLCPENIDLIINSNSCDSELSKNSQYSGLSERSQSISSIECDVEIETENKSGDNNFKIEKVEPDQSQEEINQIEDITKNWSGMGNIKIIEKDGKLRDLNRCVFNILKKSKEEIDIDLIGFDFGTIELNISPKNIKELSDLEIMIKGSSSYVLTFDNEKDIEMFYGCIY